MTNSCRISSKRIAQTITVIDPVFLNSPQVLDEWPSNRFACRLVMKLEAKIHCQVFSVKRYSTSLQENPHE